MSQSNSRFVHFVVVAGALGAGCGNDQDDTAGGGGAGGGGPDVAWAEYCDGRSTLDCTGFDVAGCNEQANCARALVRDEVEDAMLDCLLGACSFEGCLTETSGVPRSAAGEAFFNACAVRVTECGLGDDACYAGNLVSDAVIAELDLCLDLTACAEMDACITTTFDARFEACTAWF